MMLYGFVLIGEWLLHAAQERGSIVVSRWLHFLVDWL